MAGRRANWARAGLLIAFAWLSLSTAWLGDDAYITLRTVANFLDGYGLVWNVGERVQSYTHPLWMMLLVAANALTGEPYYSTILLSVAISSAAAAWIVFRVAPDAAGAALAIIALMNSKAYVDFSTSGLENPLTHLLLAILYWQSRRAGHTPRSLARVTLLSSLLLLNRLDLGLVVAPLLLCCVWPMRSWAALRALCIGALPLIAWEIFSIVYYGFPLPNTAYAKLDLGVPAGELFAQGVAYLWHTARIDWPTTLLIGGGLTVGLIRRDAISRAIVIGVGLHLLLVIKIGGDFMGGRMLTAPFLMCVLLVSDSRIGGPRATWLAAVIVALLGLVAPLSPLTTRWEDRVKTKFIDAAGIADEPAFYFEHTGLPLVWRGSAIAHPWVEEGRRAAAAAAQAGVPVLTVHANVGFFGYFAGAQVHIVDELALTDAFLARMPADRSKPWRIGHTYRIIPDGYLESLEADENRLVDPALAERFDRLQRITRGPLLEGRRFSDVLVENFPFGADLARPAPH
jgi:arabinofuranosyltransferase